jgi:hypothetical protein
MTNDCLVFNSIIYLILIDDLPISKIITKIMYLIFGINITLFKNIDE